MLNGIRERGVTLIEMVIGMVIVSLLLTLAMPSFTTFIQNTQIRNAAETTLQGINIARTNAVRLDTAVRFQLVSDFSSACVLSPTTLNWIVSLADPTGLCNVTPVGDNASLAAVTATDPQIVQEQSAREGSANVTVATIGGPSIVFNGLGRVVGAGTTQMDFTNPAGGTCQYVDPTNGKMRCLRLQVATGGQTKLCDPQVGDPTDPRICN